jgi:hypothetical protein
MKNFRVTYDIVTNESAEHGDAAEGGFLGRDYGLHWQVWPNDETKEQDKAQFQMTLREAMDCVGCVEGSDGSYYETDGRQDYRTGDYEQRALHAPDNITASSLARVERVLRKEHLLR